MKKFCALVLCGVMALSLCSCTKDDKGTTQGTGTDEVDTVEEEKDDNLVGVNQVVNGDFAEESNPWQTYTNGGKCSISRTDTGELQVKIESVGSLDYACQIYYDGFTLDEGCKYKVAFDASSSIERTIQWRVQINGGDYHAYSIEEIPITTEMSHYEVEFTMEEASDPAPRMCINMGVNEGSPEGTAEHTITFDNFELVLTDDSGKIQAEPAPETPNVNINQVGYEPDDTKTVIFRGDSTDAKFDVVDVNSNETVYSGDITGKKENSVAGETDYYGDFTSVSKEGTYKIVTDTMGESYEFQIKKGVYDDLYKDVVNMIYLQRCGMELTSTDAGDYAHPACHTGMATIYGTDKTKDVSGGWHDAGDYGRYVVSGAKTVADMLLTYEDYGNQALINEAKYELDWLLKMQDEETGGVYHKVTCANFPSEVMPEEETEELIISPMSNAASGDFAAVMAMASRIYSDDAEFSATCLAASKRAYNYMSDKMTEPGFTNPEGIVTGEYGDKRARDERFWAACELYKATGEAEYLEEIKKFTNGSVPEGLGWADVGTYGVYAYLTSDYAKLDSSNLYKTLESALIAKADELVTASKEDGYQISLGDSYPWGSNMTVANNGMLLLMANKISPNEEYVDYAETHVNYLLGANATSYCFVTGYGTLSPLNTHHRPSQAQGESMIGMLVGGPDSALEDPYARAVLVDTPAAKCYADNAQSYSCNEVTIYWNSPLIYLLSGTK